MAVWGLWRDVDVERLVLINDVNATGGRDVGRLSAPLTSTRVGHATARSTRDDVGDGTESQRPRVRPF